MVPFGAHRHRGVLLEPCETGAETRVNAFLIHLLRRASKDKQSLCHRYTSALQWKSRLLLLNFPDIFLTDLRWQNYLAKHVE